MSSERLSVALANRVVGELCGGFGWVLVQLCKVADLHLNRKMLS